jgi:hypothetical protein
MVHMQIGPNRFNAPQFVKICLSLSWISEIG